MIPRSIFELVDEALRHLLPAFDKPSVGYSRPGIVVRKKPM